MNLSAGDYSVIGALLITAGTVIAAFLVLRGKTGETQEAHDARIAKQQSDFLDSLYKANMDKDAQLLLAAQNTSQLEAVNQTLTIMNQKLQAINDIQKEQLEAATKLTGVLQTRVDELEEKVSQLTKDYYELSVSFHNRPKNTRAGDAKVGKPLGPA